MLGEVRRGLRSLFANGVDALEWPVYAAVAVGASLAPALQATRVDPNAWFKN